MPRTYEPIASQTLTGTAADVTFSSIASTWTDLRLVCSLVGDGSTFIYITLNGDTSSLHSMTTLYGTGSSAGSFRDGTRNSVYLNYGVPVTASNRAVVTADFMSTGSTSVFKTFLVSVASSAAEVSRTVGLYRSTSAVNSIKVFPSGGQNWASGSTFSLYGIKAA